MTNFPLQLYQLGYADLVSVIPPGAPLVPGSRMQSSSLGKAPGVKTDAGWRGYNWREYNANQADVNKWAEDGANFGLRADKYPGLDIDVTDAETATWIEELAKRVLGPAPVRYGRMPKRLLVYRSADGSSLTRVRLWLERAGESHMVELLGVGQQYLVHGIHPVTMKPYAWDTTGFFPAPAGLQAIAWEDARNFFDALKVEAEKRGWSVHREGDGHAHERAKVAQDSLRAPSIERLEDLVDTLPNDDKSYPGRDAYIKMGYAIRAAAGDDIEDGYNVFASWASRHKKDARVSGNPATWRADYDRMRPPFTVGWAWLQDEARRFKSDAGSDFDAIYPTLPAEDVSSALTAPPASPEGVLGNGDLVGYTLGEWQEHPEYAEMPPPVIPHFAWRGLKTLFSGREKIGKSTLLLAGAAAVSSGADFLGEGTERQKVLWLTEEAVVLTIHRAKEMSAHPDNFVITPMGKDPRAQLASAVRRYHPTVVVIDTLFRYAGIDDENNASQWHPFLKDFDAVTATGAALVFVVHALKSREDGGYRGSSALGAWVDVIIAMANPSPESFVRKLSAKGRVNADAFDVRYDKPTFRLLTDGEKASASEQAAVKKAVEWLENGKAGTQPSMAAAAKAGLVVKDGGKWRLTTADERAQGDMQ